MISFAFGFTVGFASAFTLIYSLYKLLENIGVMHK